MTANNTPLTQQQTDFAAAHHNLIYSFLNKRKYSVDKFYDIVVFGYLRAVRNYINREELRGYAFSTIAFNSMRSEISSYFRAQNAQMRLAVIIPFDDNSLYTSNGRGFADDYDEYEQLAA